MNGRSRIWAIALLVVVLAAGGLMGAAVQRTFLGGSICQRSSERGSSDRDRRGSYLEWLSSELDLSAEQQAEIEQLVEENREAVAGLWHEMRPRFEELKVQLRADIHGVLRQDQQAAYEALLEERSRRRDHNYRDRNRR